MDPALPIDKRSKRVAGIAATFVFAIAAAAVASRLAGFDVFARITPAYPPVTAAAAIGILGLAVGLAGLARGSAGWALFGAALVIVGGGLGDLSSGATSVAGALTFVLSGVGIATLAVRR